MLKEKRSEYEENGKENERKRSLICLESFKTITRNLRKGRKHTEQNRREREGDKEMNLNK